MSKKDYEGYIKYNESIGYMLNNIAEMAIVIHKDFQNNGATHPAYIVEKLGIALYNYFLYLLFYQVLL